MCERNTTGSSAVTPESSDETDAAVGHANRIRAAPAHKICRSRQITVHPTVQQGESQGATFSCSDQDILQKALHTGAVPAERNGLGILRRQPIEPLDKAAVLVGLASAPSFEGIFIHVFQRHACRSGLRAGTAAVKLVPPDLDKSVATARALDPSAKWRSRPCVRLRSCFNDLSHEALKAINHGRTWPCMRKIIGRLQPPNGMACESPACAHLDPLA